MAEDLSKIEDFSERITPVEGAKTGIFWDVEDYPFPVCPSPDLIYQKIESAINVWGCFMGKVSIWAYVDEKKGSFWCQFVRKKTWKSRIYFLDGGDKPARRSKMLHDILIWKMDSPVDHIHSANLIVVSDKVKDDNVFFHTLRIACLWFYNVFLVQSTENIPPESPNWPELLLDEVYCFLSEREELEERDRKKKQRAEGSEDQGETS